MPLNIKDLPTSLHSPLSFTSSLHSFLFLSLFLPPTSSLQIVSIMEKRRRRLPLSLLTLLLTVLQHLPSAAANFRTVANYEVACTMCATCQPCNPTPVPDPSPPPPPPSPPPPAAPQSSGGCPPPPSSSSGGGGGSGSYYYSSPPPPSQPAYYYPPPSSPQGGGGSSGGYYYSPPYQSGPAPPPPNPIVPYFPYYYHSPPPGNSGSALSRNSIFSALPLVLFFCFFL